MALTAKAPHLYITEQVYSAIAYSIIEFCIGYKQSFTDIVRTITFSHYLAHTELIFDTQNILNFSNLVVHSIGLMMFKYSKDLVPLPIVELFTRNYEFHNHYNTRQCQSLHLQLAITKRSTKHLHLMAFEFENTNQQKFQYTFRMPVLNILQNY